MGIDAKIVLRVTGYKPTDEQVIAWSDAICRSIGAKHFFISDGLPVSTYQSAYDAWHKSFNEHPTYSEYKRLSNTGSHEERRVACHEQILSDIGPCPEQLRRAIEFTNERYPLEEGEESDEYRIPGKCYTQDADTMYAGNNTWFLNVSVWTRYYGVGYERGDLLTLCAIAEWCECNIPNCEVFYGGDSSGVAAEPWTEEKRRELRKHMYSQAGREYFDRGAEIHPDPCGLCVGSGNFSQYGFGGNYAAVHCASCGKSFESRDNGANWTNVKS
jgi:hypothetical protein